MNTRQYPRTLDQAFPRTASYASAIEKPAPKSRSYLWFSICAVLVLVLVALGVVK